MSRITAIRMTGTVSGTTFTTTSKIVSGRILKIGINYPTNTIALTLKSGGESVIQDVLALGAANTDITYYPRVAVHDNAGTEVTFDGSNQIYEPYLVHGELTLAATSGTAADVVTIDIVLEEF